MKTDNKINELSVFPMSGGDLAGNWLAIKSSCSYLSDWGIGTLRRGLDGYVKTVVLEKYYTCKDHRNLFSNFYSKKFRAPNSICDRLHFFNTSFTDPADVKIRRDELKDSYIGFAVIRDVKERCLGRTVINPGKIGKNIESECFCLSAEFSSNIGGARYSINGYPYMSQDTDATVCAHSALWGVCRYLSQRFHFYKEVHPYDLIRMTGHMQGRVIPYRAMTYTDYSTILTEFGCYPIIVRLKDNSKKQDKERFKDLYTPPFLR
jgi:hypothetical protein